MANIYELKTAYKSLQAAIETGDNEELDSILETLDEAIEDKADGYACVMKNLESDIEGLKAEEKRIAEKRKGLESNVTKLKDNLFNTMKETGKTKFKTKLFSFNIAKNGGKIPVIVDVECDDLPDKLVIVSEKPNLDELRKYIEETGDVSYAHLGERGESLRIK